MPPRPNTVATRVRERPRIGPLTFDAPKQQQGTQELNAHVKEISSKNGLVTVDGKVCIKLLSFHYVFDYDYDFFTKYK